MPLALVNGQWTISNQAIDRETARVVAYVPVHDGVAVAGLGGSLGVLDRLSPNRGEGGPAVRENQVMRLIKACVWTIFAFGMCKSRRFYANFLPPHAR